MCLWNSQNGEDFGFRASDLHASELGYIVENRLLEQALIANLYRKNKVHILDNTVTKIENFSTYKRCYFADDYIDANLVIAADGANSWLRENSGITTVEWDYAQKSIVATVMTDLPHKNIAYQRFADDGPLAFLPLDKPNYCSIVWTSNSENVNNIMQMDTEKFSSLLAQEFDYKLGNIKLHGDRANFPLRLLHAKDYIAERLVLIGDSAHVIHPLAGQGLNLGIMDAATLFDVIRDAVLKNRDCGSWHVLRKYERWRKGHNLSMLAITDSIKRYGNLVTKFDLSRVSSIKFINNYILRYAMGVMGELPSSAI